MTSTLSDCSASAAGSATSATPGTRRRRPRAPCGACGREDRKVSGAAPGADLHAMQAERALERARYDRAFLLEQEAAERAGEPGIEFARMRGHAESITAAPRRGQLARRAHCRTLAHARRAADPGVPGQLHLDDPRHRRSACRRGRGSGRCRAGPRGARARRTRRSRDPRDASPRGPRRRRAGARGRDGRARFRPGARAHAGGVAASRAGRSARSIPELGLEFRYSTYPATRPDTSPTRVTAPLLRATRCSARAAAACSKARRSRCWRSLDALAALPEETLRLSAATSTPKPIYGSP